MLQPWKKYILIASLGCGVPLAEGRTPLTLDDYLQEVRKANFGVRGATATIEAAELREGSSDLPFTPQFFTQITQQSDEKPQASTLAGVKTEALALSFGVQKLWDFGLQSQISYQVADIAIDRNPLPLPPVAPGVPNPLSALGDDAAYKEAQTRIDLAQPLWKNWAGREYDLTREGSATRLLQQKQGEAYKVRLFLAQAEATYWQLALAQEAVRMQQDTLQRFQKIRDWVASRVRLSLADRADLLQAEAGVKARSYELELARVDRTSKQRLLNSLRGVVGESFDRDLQELSPKLLQESGRDPGGVKRLDIEVAKQAEKLSAIELQQLRERFTPQLDLFGTVAFNSDQEDQYGKAAAGAFQSDKPTLIVGLKLSAPLDRALINRERQGLIKLSEASRIERENREFSAQQEWEELLRQLSDARQRLKLASELETAQRRKLEYEKERHERGRSTTYQILLFEQDFANAQLMTIKAKADILMIASRLKTFGDAS